MTEGRGGQGSGVFVGPRTILTAFHVITRDAEDDGEDVRFEAKIEVEVHRNVNGIEATIWLPCRVAKHDSNFDLALLVTDDDLPFVAPIAQKMPEIGSAVFIVGSPAGASPTTASFGYLASRGGTGPDELPFLAESSASCFFGNSGGGVWNANTGELIGVLVRVRMSPFAGVAPNGSLFVPLPHLKTLLAGRP